MKKEEPRVIINTDDLESIKRIWNSIGIGQTRWTNKQINVVSKSLKKYSLREVLEALSMYYSIFNDEEYFFNHKYKIETFFSNFRNEESTIVKFLPGGRLFEQYNKWCDDKKSRNVIQKSIPACSGLYYDYIKEMKSMDYKEYLLTEHWKHFISEAVKYSNYKCQLCNKDHTQLHVHHKTYENRGRETFNDIIVLCAECHSMVHGVGKIEAKND